MKRGLFRYGRRRTRISGISDFLTRLCWDVGQFSQIKCVAGVTEFKLEFKYKSKSKSRSSPTPSCQMDVYIFSRVYTSILYREPLNRGGLWRCVAFGGPRVPQDAVYLYSFGSPCLAEFPNCSVNESACTYTRLDGLHSSQDTPPPPPPVALISPCILPEHIYPLIPSHNCITMPAAPKTSSATPRKSTGAPKTKGAVRAKSGCYTCRIRRKVSPSAIILLPRRA